MTSMEITRRSQGSGASLARVWRAEPPNEDTPSCYTTNIQQPPNDHPTITKLDRESIENRSRIYRTTAGNLWEIYGRSIEKRSTHPSNIQRMSTNNEPEVHHLWNSTDSMKNHGIYGIPWASWTCVESMGLHGIHGNPQGSVDFHGTPEVP